MVQAVKTKACNVVLAPVGLLNIQLEPDPANTAAFGAPFELEKVLDVKVVALSVVMIPEASLVSVDCPVKETPPFTIDVPELSKVLLVKEVPLENVATHPD